MIATVKVTDNKSLNEAITFLENQRKSEMYLLKQHFEFTKEQLNPVTIIKEGFSDVISSPNLKDKLIKGALGIASGFFAKKLVIGTGGGIVSKIAGTALQTGVSALAMKMPDTMETVKDNGISMLQKGLDKLKIK